MSEASSLEEKSTPALSAADQVRQWTLTNPMILGEPLMIVGEEACKDGEPGDKLSLEIALQLLREPSANGEELHLVLCNGVRARKGSDHFQGLVDAWRRALKSQLMQKKMILGNALPRDLDFLQPAAFVISVNAPASGMQGSENERLKNPQVRQMVRQLCKKPFAKLFKEHLQIIEQVVAANQSAPSFQHVLRETTNSRSKGKTSAKLEDPNRADVSDE